MVVSIIKGILIGASFTGVMLAVVAYFGTINSNSGGGFLGPERDWWRIAVAEDFVLGVFIGGLSGAVIAGFNWNFTKALFLSGSMNLLLVVCVWLFLGNEGLSDSIKYSLYWLVPIGLITAAAVSLNSYVRPNY
jgi:hypothetical protein